MLDLSIIIINYNGAAVIGNCLQALEAHPPSRYRVEVIVVDNGSTDQSLTILSRLSGIDRLIKNRTNLGFSQANNQAAAYASGRYLLFLNSDTLVLPHTLDQLLHQAHQHQAKIASPQLLNPDGTIQPQGGALPHWLNLLAWMLFIDDLPGYNHLLLPYQQRRVAYFHRPKRPGWIAGTAMLIERQTFNQLAGFDPNIFMYGEDVELCFRASKLGIKPFYFPDSRLIHFGQGSGSRLQSLSGEFTGLRYFWKKHRPYWQLPLINCFLRLGIILRFCFFGMILGDQTKAKIYQNIWKNLNL